jgi:hypothetical protein
MSKLIRTFAIALACAACAAADFRDATYKGVERVVAVGDVHGDYPQFVEVLRAAGVIDRSENWAGGKTHLVQTGDVLDRGAASRKVMDLLRKLEKQSAEAGGAVHALIANHEAMNVYGDLRYVVAGEYAAFRDSNSEHLRDLYYEQFVKNLKKSPPPEGLPKFDAKHRRTWDAEHPLGFFEHRMAFAPDRVYGKWIRGHNAVVKIDDSIFLHGGIGPKYASKSLRDMNEAVARELEDFSKLQGGVAMDENGPLWYRGLALEEEKSLSAHVQKVLDKHGIARIVIGHTPTRGAIVPRFNGRVLMIDVGLVIEGGKPYALHRGTKLQLPSDGGTDLIRYLKQAIMLDPPPSPLQRSVAEAEAALAGGR